MNIAKEFVLFYYNCLDNDRQQMVNLYRPNSMLTFENTKKQGQQEIAEYIFTLPQSARQLQTLDAQPIMGNGVQGLLIFVSGQIQTGPGENPLMFSQVFTLYSENGSYFVLNDIFKFSMAV